MEIYLEQIIDWIFTLSPASIYVIFGLIAYFENVFPPVPGDVLVVFGGYLAAEQVVSFMGVLSVTTFASVVGFMNMYAIGRYFGDKIERQRSKFWLMKFVDVRHFDRGKRWMHRWGQKVILANRFLAGTRSVISVTAGLTNVKAAPTILSSAISSLLWNSILIWLGFIVNENWQIIGEYLNIYGWLILLLLVIGVLIRYFYKSNKKKKISGRED